LSVRLLFQQFGLSQIRKTVLELLKGVIKASLSGLEMGGLAQFHVHIIDFLQIEFSSPSHGLY
jgi:hypothetical protein